MDYNAVLNLAVFYGMLIGLPVLSVAVYLVLFVHHSDRLQAQFQELKQAAQRQSGKLEAFQRKTRYSDPLFRFRPALATPAPLQTAKEAPTQADQNAGRIATAVETGRFVMQETGLDQIQPGMVLGKAIELPDGNSLEAGTPLDADAILLLSQAGIASVPILYNPKQ